MATTSNRTEYHARIYFRGRAELREATAKGDPAAAALALGEIAQVWLYSGNARLRSQCAAILEQHGWDGGAEPA